MFRTPPPRPRRPSAVPPIRLAMAAAGIIALVVGCTGGASSSPSPSPVTESPAPSVAPSASATPSGSGPASPPPARAVRFALDWTPNTNHLGLFVAQAQGWYAEAGVGLDLLPYTGTAPETLLAAGQADCGISFHDSLTFAVAAGAPIRSVMAVLQHTAQELAVLEASTITRPRDLDGTVYAGFGYPNEEPTVQAVIRADGGTGTFTTVTLDTAAYEALYAKRADVVITFTAWEGVEAGLRGIDLRTFAFTDYGFPDFYQVVIACRADWLDAEPELARAFVGATIRGLELAQADPEAAAAMLVAENPGVFDANPELPTASARFLADGGYLVDAAGRIGTQTAAQWRGYAAFLYETGLLVGPDGQPLTAPPDYGSLFTTEFAEP